MFVVLLSRIDTERRWVPTDARLIRVRKAVGVGADAIEEQLRAERRSRMRSVSDEALYDLEAYTTLIYRTRGGT
jgi:hypothetical protein